MSWTIRTAGPSDAAALAAFGARVFSATFAADNDPVDFEAYLSSAYTPAAQAAELADPAITTRVVCDEAGTFIAFAQTRRAPVPECVDDASAVELWRFYVDPAWHGRGVAQQLMTIVDEDARALGASSIWLGVWEHNLRAQAFYRKCGFAPVGSHVFMVGTDAQTDQIWTKASPGR